MARRNAAELESAIVQFTKSTAFQQAEKDLDLVAVCLIGTTEPVPYRLGSNATRWPVRIVTTRDPGTAAKRPDVEQPIHPLAVLDYVWTRSDAHARRLKHALDAAMIGEDPALTALRHSWRDCPDPSVAWTILLGDAVRSLAAGGEVIQCLTEQERVQMILGHARARVRGRA